MNRSWRTLPNVPKSRRKLRRLPLRRLLSRTRPMRTRLQILIAFCCLTLWQLDVRAQDRQLANSTWQPEATTKDDDGKGNGNGKENGEGDNGKDKPTWWSAHGQATVGSHGNWQFHSTYV